MVRLTTISKPLRKIFPDNEENESLCSDEETISAA
jgi:hypothetical protein